MTKNKMFNNIFKSCYLTHNLNLDFILKSSLVLANAKGPALKNMFVLDIFLVACQVNNILLLRAADCNK